MTDDIATTTPVASGDTTSGPANDNQRLSPAAERALAEAAERRAKAEGQALPREVDGRGGLEPVRYGDWEIKGLIADF